MHQNLPICTILNTKPLLKLWLSKIMELWGTSTTFLWWFFFTIVRNLKNIYFLNQNRFIISVYIFISLCIHIHTLVIFLQFSSVQFSSVHSLSRAQLCDPMNHSTPGLPVHHQLPEFTQTHVYRVSDAIQPSHPRSSPSPPALNPSQHQSLFQGVNSSHEVAKVLEFQL